MLNSSPPGLQAKSSAPTPSAYPALLRKTPPTSPVYQHPQLHVNQDRHKASQFIKHLLSPTSPAPDRNLCFNWNGRTASSIAYFANSSIGTRSGLYTSSPSRLLLLLRYLRQFHHRVLPGIARHAFNPISFSVSSNHAATIVS